MRRIFISAACGLVAAGAIVAASAQADFPYPTPSGGSHDWTQLHVPSGTIPNDLDPNDFRFLATPEPNNHPVNEDPRELFGVRGSWTADPSSTASTAWSVTTGRPDVTIAELDSGVDWTDVGFVLNERFKIALNKGELPTPNHDGPALVDGVNCSTYKDQDDANGDGVFNLLDFACDNRLSKDEPNSSGPSNILDPEDLIIAFSDGTDADHNGYVDDIAGWDFLDNDNDPYDDVHYTHGTGEIQGSTAEANNGGGTPGFCPNCMGIPLRVGDSFIADDNRFAMAATYAVDRNVDIIQEALGTLNDSAFAQAAIDYAYRHGVAVIASAADEAAQHHNYPSSHAHTIVVNSVRNYDTTPPEVPRSYLDFNGCTNFSSKVTLAMPSTSCSSNATEVGAGIAGLIYSAAKNAVQQNKMKPNPGCTRIDGKPCPISANEVRQLMASGSFGLTASTLQTQPDDVNYLAGNPGEPSCSPAPLPGCTDPNGALQTQIDANRPIVSPPDSRSYPARFGFDQFFGYGRVNAWRATSQAAAGHVPPEVEITSPRWFAQVDPDKPTADVRAQVWARGAAYTCAVYVAPGSYPNNHLTTDSPPGDFKKVPSPVCDGSTKHTARIDGSVAALSLSDLKSRFPPDATANGFHGTEQGSGAGQTSNGRPDSEPYGFTVRVVATTTAEDPGLVATGEDRRNLYLHRDASMLPGFPKQLPGDGESSPAFADLNGDNRNEMVFGTSDGYVHAMRPDGTELAGWPVRTDPLPIHTGERAFTSGELSPDISHGAVLSSPAVADLNRDGSPEVIASDMEGKVYVWDSHGHLEWKREANPDWSGKPLTPFVNERLTRRDRTHHSFIASPVAADLSGNGTLDVVIPAMDRHLYAWTDTGHDVSGFPVLVVDQSKVGSIDSDSQEIRWDPKNAPDEGKHTPDQGAIIDTPAVGDISGDKRPEIVLGTNEEYHAGKGNEGSLNAGGFNAASIQAIEPALSQVLTPANSRLYAIRPTGDADGNPRTADWMAAGRWPFHVGLLDADLLPVVGEGITGAPVIGPAGCMSSTGGREKIGVIPNNGFGYVLNADATSCVDGKNGTMDTDKGNGTDKPQFAAVGHPAFADIAGGISFVAPVAGLLRAADLLINEYQMNSQDFISAWDPSNGQFRPGWPAHENDLQFLTGPSIANVDGNSGNEELLEGSAYLDLEGYNDLGQPIAGFPKLTSDWMVANPLIGTWGTVDTDKSAHRVVVAITRNGTILAYKTPAAPCEPNADHPLGSWPRFHHDNANSGDYSRDAVDPGTPTGVRYSKGTLTFTAPGDDLMCGTVARYEAAEASFRLTGASFDQGDPIPTDSISGKNAKGPGTKQTLALGGNVERYVAIRAVDDQGNVGPAVTVATRKRSGGGGHHHGGGGHHHHGRARCGDFTPPKTTFAARHGVRRRHGRVIAHGKTTDRGCRTASVGRKLNRLLVSVSVFHRSRGRCRFLERDGTLGAARSCKRPTKLRASGRYSFAKRTLRWRFAKAAHLPPGRYVVVAKAVDQSGNVERKHPRNRRTFRVPRPRSSALR